MFDANSNKSSREFISLLLPGSRLLHCDDTGQIISIETRFAAEFWFSGTCWCVKGNPWFEGYLSQGPLLLLRSFKRQRDYLLAPASNEFRNARNRRVSLGNFVTEHPDFALALRLLGIFWGRPADDTAAAGTIIFVKRSYSKFVDGR